jgi:hypothetical protein
MLYTLRFFFSSKCSLFHNANLFGSCIIHILYIGCAKIKKKNNNSGAKCLNITCPYSRAKIRRSAKFAQEVAFEDCLLILTQFIVAVGR